MENDECTYGRNEFRRNRRRGKSHKSIKRRKSPDIDKVRREMIFVEVKMAVILPIQNKREVTNYAG